MKHTSIRKPLSVLLSILMVLSVFGGMTFTASAEDQMETISFRNEHEVRTISGTHFTITPHASGGIYADGNWDFDGDYPDDYAELSAVYGETITKLVFHIDTGYDNYPIVKAGDNRVAGSQSGDLWTFDNVNASSVRISANPNYEAEGKDWWCFEVFELDVYFDASNAPAPSDIVAELISAIGTVTLTNDCKEKIDAARSAYDKLAEADQALVSNYTTLTDAEADYQALVDQAAADRAIAAINKIGEFEVSPAYKVRFDQANNTYNGLTDAQKALVTNYDVLEAARAAAEALPYVSAGSFGGLYWAIDKDGVMTFAGSGETNLNAFKNNSSIRKVIINSSVTRLKSYSFGYCSNLTEVEFQNSNPKIDNFVFAGCGNLSKVTLAEGVTKIGYNMFNGCGSLHELTLPRSVNYIDGEAFAGSGIRTLRIPYGLGHTTNALAGMGQLTTLVIDSDSPIAFTDSQFPDLGSVTNVYVPAGSTFKSEDTKKWDLFVKDEYLNDYDANDFADARALFNMSVYDYYNEVSYALEEVEEYGYERDKYEAREVTVPGMDVTLTDGAQIASLFGAATIRTYTTALSSVEALIDAIGTVELTDDCKAKIDAARAAYNALNDAQKNLLFNYQTLVSAEEQYAALQLAAADKAAFDAYKAEQKAAVEALAVEGDSTDAQQIIADAAAAIDALTYDEAKTLDENKAAVDAAADIADALATQRAADAAAAQLAADRAAFDAYKAEQKAAVEALAVEGDSTDAQQIITDAAAAIEALTYDEAKTLDENKAAVDALANIADRLAAQRATDLYAAKIEFDYYKAEQKAAVEAMAQEGDSEAVAQIIADAAAAIDALIYDEFYTLAENKATVDTLANIADRLAAQRAADAAAAQLAADKAAFDDYKADQKAAVQALAEEGDSEAAQNIIADAAAAIAALTYDEAKTLDENKAAVDALADITDALAAQRAADKAAALIDAIGEVEYTDECKAKIDAAREAYDALTDDQKALVENDDVLTAAESKYDELKAAAETPDDPRHDGVCPECGKNHGNNLFGALTAIIHHFLAFIKNITSDIFGFNR